MDAIELLLADHRTVDGLFQQFERGGNTQEFAALFTQLKDELTVHTQIEEEIFYPAARNNPDTADLVAEAYEEQAEAKQALDQISGMDNTSTEWGEKMTQLMRDIQAHVQMEETELFPRVRTHFSADQLQQLGQKLQQRKSELKGDMGATPAPMYESQANYTPAPMYESQATTTPSRMDNTTGELGAMDATTDTRPSSEQSM